MTEPVGRNGLQRDNNLDLFRLPEERFFVCKVYSEFRLIRSLISSYFLSEKVRCLLHVEMV